MHPIQDWLAQHRATDALVGYWLFSALVSGMPAPADNSSLAYVWLYRSLHFIASNLNSVFARKGVTLPAPDAGGK